MARKRYPIPQIITCREWGARPPLHRPVVTGRPDKIVYHHTAGHAKLIAPVSDNSKRVAEAYARSLQNDMMDRRHWDDSGHNFLVMRSGLILQGRWGTITAIEHGRMVVSAHCPGENTNPGIEHEHIDSEELTEAQRASSVALMAWICDRTGISPTQIYGHSHFYQTECPGSLNSEIKAHRLLVAQALTRQGRGRPRRSLWARVSLSAARRVES